MKFWLLICMVVPLHLMGAATQIAHIVPSNGVLVEDRNGYNPTIVGSLTFSVVGGVYTVSGFSPGNFARAPVGLRTDFALAHNAWQIDIVHRIPTSVAGGALMAWAGGGGANCSGANFFGIFGSLVYGLELAAVGLNCFDTTAGTPVTGSFQKSTVSWDGTNKRYYINNVLVTTDATSGNFGTIVSAMDFGAASDTADGDQPYNGAIAEITIWNGAYCTSDPCTDPSPTVTSTYTNSPAGTLTNTPNYTPTNTPTNTVSPTATPTPYLTFTPNVTITPAPANGLGTLPIGWWDSFAAYGDDVTEAAITSSAQAMVNNGMSLYYNYIFINEGWTPTERIGNEAITWDPLKFPDGLPATIAFCHSLGFKVALYTSMPLSTCGGFVGSGEIHIDIDANAMASYGGDGVYLDQCTQGQLNVRTITLKWWNAIAATGRPMFLESSQYGQMNPELWAPSMCNAWRTAPDSNDSFNAAITNWLSALAVSSYQRPGSFISIEISSADRGAQSLDQYRVAKTFNCMLPGTDLCNDNVTTISAGGLTILNNRYANAVRLDPLTMPCRLVQDFGIGGQIYGRPLAGNRWAFGMLNTAASGVTPTVTFSLAIASYNAQMGTNYTVQTKASVYDIWNATNRGRMTGTYSGYAPATGINFSIADFSSGQNDTSRTNDKTRS